jgi:hypothetical protein
MAQPAPLKIYGMGLELGQKLVKKPPLSEAQLHHLLSREQIIGILVTNKINDERLRQGKNIC